MKLTESPVTVTPINVFTKIKGKKQYIHSKTCQNFTCLASSYILLVKPGKLLRVGSIIHS